MSLRFKIVVIIPRQPRKFKENRYIIIQFSIILNHTGSSKTRVNLSRFLHEFPTGNDEGPRLCAVFVRR